MGSNSSHFQLRNNLSILGGFHGTEKDASQADFNMNPVIFCGILDHDAGSCTGGNERVDGIFVNGSDSTVNQSAVLFGVSIVGGGSKSSSAGGMQLVHSSPVIINVNFIHNFGLLAGGLYVKNDSRVAFKIHTNTIEGFWGELKRGIKGIYHWASHKHIQKYCNEFAYRYNNREMKNNERFVDFLSGLANTKLTYKTLTA